MLPSPRLLARKSVVLQNSWGRAGLLWESAGSGGQSAGARVGTGVVLYEEGLGLARRGGRGWGRGTAAGSFAGGQTHLLVRSDLVTVVG